MKINYVGVIYVCIINENLLIIILKETNKIITHILLYQYILNSTLVRLFVNYTFVIICKYKKNFTSAIFS